jgi:hypothetical protein
MAVWNTAIKTKQNQAMPSHSNFFNGFEEKWNNHIRRQRRQIINGLMENEGVYGIKESSVYGHIPLQKCLPYELEASLVSSMYRHL